jgi:acid phosphatase
MFRSLFAILCCATAWAQTAEPPSHQKLIPTLWAQTSEEWRGLTAQCYRLAALMLDQALREKRWTAMVQAGDFRKLPPAVILDIDETVMDNSPSQAREVKQGRGFDPSEWMKWVSESGAAAIPGAVEFCRYAASRKVALYYVSNREAAAEAATRANLARLGFPLSDRQDTVLLRGERPEWGSEKETRRAAVASRHRVLLLIGDDLGDFLAGARSPVEKRRELMKPHLEKWGRQWIVLPNPGYGSWEEALYGEPRPATAEARLGKKFEWLREK